MYYSDKPKRSESDEEIRNDRTSSLLYYLTDDIGKRKTDENTCKKPFRNTKICRHSPSVEKYISIDECVEKQENTEKEEKIGVTHEIVNYRLRKRL